MNSVAGEVSFLVPPPPQRQLFLVLYSLQRIRGKEPVGSQKLVAGLKVSGGGLSLPLETILKGMWL